MASATIQPLAISSRAAIVVGVMVLAFIALRVPSGRASQWNAKVICASHACRTIIADARVRVFRATDRRGYDIVFAEWLPRHQVRELDFPRSEPLTAIALTGPVIADAIGSFSGIGGEVYVEDLQPGHTGDGGSWSAAENIEAGSAGVRHLAVTASGSVAWLVEGHFMDPANIEAGPYPNSRAVFCASRTGEPVLLSYGPTITPTDLKAHASRCSSRPAS
jgi:hypothetical protein